MSHQRNGYRAWHHHHAGATGYVFNGVNSGALTVTAGGITAHESVAFNVPVSIGAPQTWTIDSGKSLTVGGIHTIISNLTINAAGNVYVNGVIDGGGVLNANGAAPGSITFSGAGSFNASGSERFRSVWSIVRRADCI